MEGIRDLTLLLPKKYEHGPEFRVLMPDPRLILPNGAPFGINAVFMGGGGEEVTWQESLSPIPSFLMVGPRSTA